MAEKRGWGAAADSAPPGSATGSISLDRKEKMGMATTCSFSLRIITKAIIVEI